jgi:DNA-binding PadR family transcriptional regulator
MINGAFMSEKKKIKKETEENNKGIFSVSWIELEILKILNKAPEPVYKGEMISYFRNKYHDTEIEEKPESSFYAIFERLEKEGFIQTNPIPGKGYKTFLEITDKGKTELHRALFWSVSTIFEGMTEELIKILDDVCIKNMGCLKEMNFGIISPNNLEFLIPKVCGECVKASEEDLPHRFNILMPYSEYTDVPFYQKIRSTYDNIPLKTNFLDRMMSILSLGLIKKQEFEPFLLEAKRLLKPGGKIAFVEIIAFESYLFEALQKMTDGFSSFFPKRAPGGFTQFNQNEVKTQIEHVFGVNKVKMIELREFVLVIAEK